MEEIKTKKKLNKKPLIICLVLAFVFGIVGFMDIKSNATESQCSIEFVMPTYGADGSSSYIEKNIVTGQDDMVVYYWQSHNQSTTETSYCCVYVVSDYPMTIMEYDSYDYGETFYPDGPYSSVEIYVNGHKKYVRSAGSILDRPNNGYRGLEFEWNNCKKITKWYDPQEFYDALIDGTLETVVDVEHLPIDDDMLVPSNLKRNVILNDTNVSTGLYMDTYDLVTWNNTSEVYRIELQRCPVVQIYKTPLFGSNEFIKEFVGEWKTEQVFEEVTNEFLKRTDSKGLLDEDADALTFKGSLTYDLSGLEQDYIYFGYRIRYVDLENNVASPWLVLMPSHSKDNYETFLEYGDSSQGDKNDGNGVVNEYKDLEDLNGAIDDVKTENDFKDKYDVVDGNADTQEVMNWLNTVVSFIKGTPNIVTSVLSFLPQPILYGMYITIFLGCIASAIAIVKALI